MKCVRVLLLLELIVAICSCAGSSHLAQAHGSLAQKAELPPSAGVVKSNNPLLGTLLQRGGSVDLKSKLRPLVPVANLVGGAMAHLTYGTMYCWGNFMSYMPAHLRFWDGQEHPGKTPDSLIILPMAIVAQAIGMPLGAKVQKWVGSRNALWLGCWTTAIGVFLASYAKTLFTFMMLYSVMFGIGIGIGYTAPIVAGWQWFPNRKGVVSGSVLVGFGSGGLVFNAIGTAMANPEGLTPVEGVFPDRVYQAFPGMLRKLALIYMALSFCGAMLVSQPKESRAAEVEALKNPVKGKSAATALKTRQFWTLWFMILFSAQSGINTVGVYKTFGSTFDNLNSDSFMSMLGGLGALFNGTGRLGWGALVDKIGFQKSFLVLTTIQIVSMAFFNLSTKSRLAFSLFTCAMFCCTGGNFSMAPTVCGMNWGENGAGVYGYLFSAFSIASIAGFQITKALVASVGWTGVFRTLSALSLTAFLLTLTWKNLDD
mmetsp:Transcript_7864/g.11986  ORF Transcript_7864/g.11986 Transcript_7864/m.11986 type:complete len:484 (-) Transcript_7864:286-1737(-)|eukprot:CAMPEP_0113944116 /NCGR_PEP_ID=MMETSP1339-20121228/30643_1 /TAXON_ID=94617 /ORGANISM="Fibrocapsa japonica" /LENGTH=483 /DNA_ID=CAMNT_0000949191 /DNA_START=75 /DNA_END=1526 /DNA_ORIENTATION=- /assembly_acc=CAM_ASM_000762